MPTLKRLFGDLVRTHRVARDLSQQQLADAAGMSEVWLRKIEKGSASPSFETIEHLAKALHVQPAELFGGKPAVDRRALSAFEQLVAKISGRSAADIKRITELVTILDK